MMKSIITENGATFKDLEKIFLLCRFAKQPSIQYNHNAAMKKYGYIYLA